MTPQARIVAVAVGFALLAAWGGIVHLVTSSQVPSAPRRVVIFSGDNGWRVKWQDR